uniref:Chondroadherin-like b n=1 Tax=Electrophorus electricus TaxID=8005 RepID=A0A4W4HHC1_ELEEL
ETSPRASTRMRVPEYLLWPSIVVLLLPALRGVQAGKCPRVCVCDSKKLTIACVGKNLTQVPPTIDEITVKLDLRRNVLGELVRAAFTDTPYLTHLDLRRCRIHTVREGAFRGLARLNTQSFSCNPKTPNLSDSVFLSRCICLCQGLLNLRMLRLSHNSLNNLDTEAFAGLLSLTRLSLDHNELQLVALTHLDFSSNPMTYLGEMSVSMAKLTHLSLAHMALQDLSVAALSLSPHLSHLDLSHNQLHYLQPLTGPSQLRSLNLTGNTQIAQGPKPLSRTRKINSYTPLEGVLEQDLRCRRQDGVRRAEEEEEEWGTQTVVTAAPKRNDKCPENCLCEPEAQHVSCEERSLTKVPRGFHANTLLLDMRGNHFHYLPSNSFRDVPKVVSLHLDGCKIQEVLDGAFRGLKELIYLYLSNNELSSLGSSVFAGTQQLMYLHLDGNRLSQFPSVAMLAHVPKLQELHLERNRITKLEPAGLLSPIPTLRGLYLTNNSISTAVPKALDPASNLEILHLGANELAEVPIDVLGHAPRLIELCLSGNTIHWIAPKAFQEVGGSLMHLYLDGQGLKKEALAGLGPALLSLSLEGNQLENLPDLSPLTGLRHLTLYGNPLMCDCSLLPLHRLDTHTGVNLSAVCGYPAELRGQNVMEVDVFRNCTTEKHYTATNSTNLRKTVQTTKPKPMLPSAVTGNPPKRKHRPTKTKPLVKPSKSDSTKSGKSESSLKKNKIVL